VIISKLF